MHCAKKFLKSNKYKILSSDPQDEMIPELSSLKNGVARAALQADIKLYPGKSKKKLQFYDICTVMTKTETETLFTLLREIFTLNLNKANAAYAKAKNKPHRKKKEDINPNASIELNFLDTEAERLDNRDHFGMSGINYSAHSETFLDKTTGSVNFEDDKRRNILTYFVNNFKDTAKKNMEAYKKKINPTSENSLEKCLLKYYVPEDKAKIESFLVKVKRALCKFDSAGLTFHYLFMTPERNHMKLFKQFLVNLEVWGSYQTLCAEDNGVYNLTAAKKASEAQIGDVLESLMDTFKEVNVEKYPLLKLLVDKAGSVGYYMALIQNHLITKNGGIAPTLNISTSKYPYISSSTLGTYHKSPSKKDEESTNLLSSRDSDSNSERASFVSSNNTTTEIEEDEDHSLIDVSDINHETLGHLIPLNCGHCGCLDEEEKALLENHLRRVFDHM